MFRLVGFKLLIYVVRPSRDRRYNIFPFFSPTLLLYLYTVHLHHGLQRTGSQNHSRLTLLPTVLSRTPPVPQINWEQGIQRGTLEQRRRRNGPMGQQLRIFKFHHWLPWESSGKSIVHGMRRTNPFLCTFFSEKILLWEKYWVPVSGFKMEMVNSEWHHELLSLCPTGHRSRNLSPFSARTSRPN